MIKALQQQNMTFFTYIYMYVVRVCARVVPLLIVFAVFFIAGGAERVSAMTLSGTLYSDEGITTITSGKTIAIAVGTTTTSLHTTTTLAGGTWTFNLGAVTVPTSTPIVIWVDGDTGTRASLFTKVANSINDIASLDLYQNRVIISHEGSSGTSTSINNMSFYDYDNDSDIQYNATASTTIAKATLTIFSNQELHIKTGKTFASGGTVTINANASSTSSTDGNLHLSGTATYTAGGNTTIGGNFTASGTATFTDNQNTLIFNASTTGKSISAPLSTIGDVYFSGVNGTWSFATSATTSNFYIGYYATVTAPSLLTIQNDYVNGGGFIHNSGTVRMASTSAHSISGITSTSSPFNNVSIDGVGSVLVERSYSSVVTVDNTLVPVIDTTNNILYVLSGGMVYRCALLTHCDESSDFVGTSTTQTSLIMSAVIDQVNGVLYLSELNGGGLIIRCALSTNCDAPGDFTTAYDSPESGIISLTVYATSTGGILFAGSYGGAIIYRCHLSTNCDAQSDFTTAYDTTAINITTMITYATSTGGILFAGSYSGGIIYRCHLSTNCDAAGDFTTAFDTPATTIQSMVIDTATGVLYAGASFLGYVYRCNLSTNCDAAGDFTSADVASGDAYLAIDTNARTLYVGNDGRLYGCHLLTNCDDVADFIDLTSSDAHGYGLIAIDQSQSTMYISASDSLFMPLLTRCVLCMSYQDTTVVNVSDLSIQNNASFTQPDELRISGNYTNNGTSTLSESSWATPTVVFTGSSAQSISGTLTATSSLGSLTFIGAGTKTFNNTASSSGTFTVGSGATVVAPSALSVGTFDNAGTFTAPSVTFYIEGSATNTGTFSHNNGTTSFAALGASINGTFAGVSAFNHVLATATVKEVVTQGNSAGISLVSALDTTNNILYSTDGSTIGSCNLTLDPGCDSLAVLYSTTTAVGPFFVDTDNGALYFTETGGSSIYKCVLSTNCDADSDYIRATTTQVSGLFRIIKDSASSTLYVGSLASTHIFRCANATGCDSASDFTVILPTTGDTSNAIALDATNNVLYVGISNSSGAGYILRCVISTGCDTLSDFSTATTTGYAYIRNIYIDPINQVLYASADDAVNTSVIRCSITTTSCDGSSDFTAFGSVSPYLGYINESIFVEDIDNSILYINEMKCDIKRTNCDAAEDFESSLFDYPILYNNRDKTMYGSSAAGLLYRPSKVHFDGPATTTNMTIDSSRYIDVSTDPLTISGNLTQNGILYGSTTATTTFNGTSAQVMRGAMVGTSTFGNLAFTGAGTKTFSDNASTSGNFSIYAGSGAVIAPSQLTISGNYSNGGTFTAGSGTTTFSGSINQTATGTMTGANGFNTVVLVGTSTKTFGANASTTNFIVNSMATAVLPPLLSISGNYSNNGTTTAGTGTTTFNGTSIQTATGTMTGTSAFANLAITNTSGSGGVSQSVIFGRSASTTDTFTMIASTSAQFLAGATSTFQNINLAGSVGRYVWLRSSTPGTQYGFYVPGTQKSVNYVDVKDSAACPVTITETNSVDSGNNSCWSFTTVGDDVVLSGTLYADEGINVITTSKTIAIAIGTSTPSVHTTTSNGTGAWMFAVVNPVGYATGTPVTIWVDGDTSTRAALFTKASSTVNNITGLDLYQNRVIVSHEGTSGTSTTISNMSFYDNDNDSDIQYNAATTTNTLTVFSNQELHIKTGKTFAPGGNVTVRANASTTSQTDGNFHIANSATYTAGGTTMLGGNFVASSSATFTPGSYTTIMNATTTGKLVYPLGSSLGNLYFAGQNATFSFATSSATTSDFLINMNATVTAPTLLTVQGDYVNGGAFVHNSGTVRMASTSAHIISGYTSTSSAFKNLTIDNSGSVSYAGNSTLAADTPETSTYGSALDKLNGVLYVGTSPNGRLYRCALSTKCDSTSDYSIATDTIDIIIGAVAVDEINATLYFGSGSTNGFLYRCALSTGCDTSTDFTIATDTVSGAFDAITIDSINGVLYAGTDTSGTIVRCVLSTGCDSSGDFTLATSTSETYILDIDIDQVNQVLYAATGNGGLILRCVLSTGCDSATDFTVASDTPQTYIWSIATDADHGVIYASTQPSGLILRCDISTGCDGGNDFVLAYDSPVTDIASLSIDRSSQVLYASGFPDATVYRCNLFTNCDSSTDFFVATSSSGSMGIYYSLIDESKGTFYGGNSTQGFIFRCVLCQTIGSTTTVVTNLAVETSATLSNNIETRISGDYTNNGISSSSLSISTSTYVFNGSSAQTISGTLIGTSSLPYVTFVGSGTKTFSTYASTTGDVAIGSGSTVSIPTALSLGRNLESYGTVNNSGTLYFTELGTSATGTLTGTGALGDVSIQPTSDLFTVATDTAESFIQGLAIDRVNQVLYAGTSANGLILRCPLNTGCDSTTDFAVATDTGTGLIHGMIVDPVNQVLYAGSGSAGWIFRCALSTGCDSATDFTLPFATSSATLVTVRSFTIDTTNQVLYAGTGSGGIILRCALSTGCDAASEFTIAADTTTTIVYNLAFDATNGVLYLGTGGTGIVLRCVVSTNCDALSEFTTATDTPETTMYSTLVDSANGVLYVGSGNNGRLYRCILSTGCDSTGDFLVALDGTPQIMRSLVIDTTNNILYVGSQSQGAYIYRCKLSSQCDEESDFISNGDTGESSIYNMVFNPGDNTVYAAAGDTNGYIFRRSGVFTFGANASTSDLTIGSASTLVAPAQLTVGGNYTNNGVFSHNGGVVTFATSTVTNSYTGVEIAPTLLGNSVPVGIAYKDGYFYTTDNTDALIYNYPYNGFSSGGAYKSVITAPYGIAYAQEHFWIVDATGDRIYKYTAAGTSTGFSFDTSNSGNGDPADLDFVDGYFWVTDSADARVYKYSATGTYTGTSFDTAGSGSLSPTGIEYANGYFYIADDSTDEIYVYTTSGTYTGTSFDTAGSGNGNPAGMTYAYGLLWVTDYSDGVVYKYSLAQTISGTLTGTSTFNNLVFSGATPKAFANNASSTHFTIATTSGEVSMPQSMTIAGNYINSTTTGFRSNDGTIYFASSTAQTLAGIMVGSSAFGTTSFLGAGTKTFSHNASTTSFVASSSSGAIIAPPHLTVMGNFTNSSTFTAGSGTTTLGGYATQTLSGTMTGTSAFNNLQITNTSGAGSSSQSIRFLAAASTTDTFTMSASTSAQFLAGATSTFQNIKLTGASGQNIYLRSSTPGTQYGFYVPGTQHDVSYVDVRDSSACPTLILATNGTNVDSGNNTCWTFAAANATIVSDAHQVFAYLQATTTISPITITEDASSASITAANDIRLIIATSTTNMRWDTTDVTPTFAGTASGKVSGTVSYAGDGAILIIDVTSDFAPGDTLGVSDLSYARFETVSPATVALGVRTAGAGTSTNNSDSKVVAITGTISIGSHSGGQINNILTSRTVSGGELLAFKLTPSGESFDITDLSFPLKGIQGVGTGELSNVYLYRDMNGDQAYDAGDVAVGGAGSVSINSQSGTITFSESFQSTTTQDYLLIGDVAEVMPTDALVLALSSANLTSTGATSLIEVTESGEIGDLQHIKGGPGAGGGGSAVGGDAPSGDGIRTGGDEGGGEDIDPNSGTTIGHEVGFNAPNTDGGSWTNGSNAYTSDGAYATANSSVSHGYGLFGFSVPSNNQITGIVVKLEASGSTAAGTISVLISWDGGSSFTETKTTSAVGLTDAVFELGSPSDTWGRSWSPSELNDGNLVVAVIANPSSNTLRIDAIQVRVYHQATGGGGGGGGAVFKEPNRFFANVYSAVGDIWEESVRSFLSWLRIE